MHVPLHDYDDGACMTMSLIQSCRRYATWLTEAWGKYHLPRVLVSEKLKISFALISSVSPLSNLSSQFSLSSLSPPKISYLLHFHSTNLLNRAEFQSNSLASVPCVWKLSWGAIFFFSKFVSIDASVGNLVCILGFITDKCSYWEQ